MLMIITAARLICSLGVGISPLGNLHRAARGMYISVGIEHECTAPMHFWLLLSGQERFASNGLCVIEQLAHHECLHS